MLLSESAELARLDGHFQRVLRLLRTRAPRGRVCKYLASGDHGAWEFVVNLFYLVPHERRRGRSVPLFKPMRSTSSVDTDSRRPDCLWRPPILER
jgi:hypothetical protein